MNKFFVADFETTYCDEDDIARVWLSCLMDETGKYIISNCIDDFMIDLFQISDKDKNNKTVVYFHNLKFDGSFLIPYLMEYGLKFETLVSKEKIFYSIKIYNGDKVIEIRDSLKKIPFKLDEFKEAFGLNSGKGKIDYTIYREEGYKATPEEIDYIVNDCELLQKGLKLMYEDGFTKSTIGSDCFKYFLKICGGEKRFRKVYPELGPCEDRFLRNGYRGGFCYLNPDFQGKKVSGKVYDINSMYPSILIEYSLPYGYGMFRRGKPRGGLWVSEVEIEFKLKPGKLPIIPNRNFFNIEYMDNSNGEIIHMTITNYDWEIIQKHYDIDYINWISYYKYKSFKNQNLVDYVKHFNELKIKANETRNKGQRTIAKLFLNNLIGKFGTNPERQNCIPCGYDDDGIVWSKPQYKETKTIYLPLALFVNSIGRYKIINDTQRAYEQGCFIYCDTDSLHVKEDFEDSELKIDKSKLGYYKLEEEFEEGKYIKLKTYCHSVRGEIKTTVAGLSENKTKITSVDEFSGDLEIEELRQHGCLYGSYLKNIKRKLTV